MASLSLPSKLLRLSLPLIPSQGFSIATLQSASLELPGAPSEGYSSQTLSALFPSAPIRRSPVSSSLSREEIILEAKGELNEHGEPVGPAQALLFEWLREGRREMRKAVEGAGHLRGADEKLRFGMRERVKYNEPVIEFLPKALALLGTEDKSSLGSIVNTLGFASPVQHLEHVAKIAHDLALAAGTDSQGVEWYQTRARLSVIYGLAELHLTSPDHPAYLTPSERTASTLELVDELWESSRKLGKRTGDAVGFAEWVGKSWLGMGKSLGL